MKKGKSTGAKSLVKTLEKSGVEVLFGYPGGANLPVYEALNRSTIRHILARHEQGAAHMADGYARATGKTGVCMATSGPGATNLVTGIANAYMDSSPLIAITGQVPRGMIGNDAFQEVDITGITIPITKHNYLVQHACDIAPITEEAFYLAESGRKGPVLIDIPKDVQTEDFSSQHEKRNKLEGYNPTMKGHPGQIKRAAGIIKSARRPVVIAGGGIFLSDAFDVLAQFIQTTGIPLVHTLMGKSALDNRNPLNLGLFGYHGNRVANTAISEADLVIAIGTRFGDRSTGPLTAFARDAKIIHIDIDPAEIGKNVPAYLPIVGDVLNILPRLVELLQPSSMNNSEWLGYLSDHKKNPPRPKQTELCSADILDITSTYLEDVILVTDVGRHQISAAQYYPVSAGRTFITSGGLGTMGFGLPAAIGASIGKPSSKVVLITGDGSFMMNIQELITAVESEVDLTILVMNDSRLGMIHQLQDYFYESRFDISRFDTDIQFDRVAEVFGCKGKRITSLDQLKDALQGFSHEAGVKVIDCVVGKDDHVYPMVTGSNLLALEEGEYE